MFGKRMIPSLQSLNNGLKFPDRVPQLWNFFQSLSLYLTTFSYFRNSFVPRLVAYKTSRYQSCGCHCRKTHYTAQLIRSPSLPAHISHHSVYKPALIWLWNIFPHFQWKQLWCPQTCSPNTTSAEQ